MKALLVIALFFAIPVTLGLISSYRAGVLWFQKKKKVKTFYEAWEDDYNGRD
jgi:hypothetical protein